MADALLVHANDPDCATAIAEMMGDAHRVGCAIGKSCRGGSNGTPARATYYAREMRLDATGKSVPRPLFLCTPCAMVFARTHGLLAP